MSQEPKDDCQISKHQDLDLQDDHELTEAHGDKFCCPDSQPAWPNKIYTNEGAASEGLQTEVVVQLDEPVNPSRSSSPATISHMLTAEPFLGPGGVGILNSDADHYPVFLRPISPTFSIDSTDQIPSPFGQTRPVINTPNLAHFKAIIIDPDSNNEANEIKCISQHEDLEKPCWTRDTYLSPRSESLYLPMLRSRESVDRRGRAQSV